MNGSVPSVTGKESPEGLTVTELDLPVERPLPGPRSPSVSSSVNVHLSHYFLQTHEGSNGDRLSSDVNDSLLETDREVKVVRVNILILLLLEEESPDNIPCLILLHVLS